MSRKFPWIKSVVGERYLERVLPGWQAMSLGPWLTMPTRIAAERPHPVEERRRRGPNAVHHSASAVPTIWAP
jgi:hypothetical protein